MKVVILKGNAPRHNFFAQQVSLIKGVEPTIVSFERLGKSRLRAMIRNDLWTFFARSTKYIIQYIRGETKQELAAFGKITLDQHIFENINSDECISFIRSVNPDLIVIFGTPIISKRIINIPKFGAINLHGGISPWYKGGNTIFWALYNNDLSKVGATIHYALPKVDSGQMLVRVYPDVNKDDSEGTISIKTFRYAVSEFCELIKHIAEKQEAPAGKIQEEGGRLYLAKKRTMFIDLIGPSKIRRNIKKNEIARKIERYYE